MGFSLYVGSQVSHSVVAHSLSSSTLEVLPSYGASSFSFRASLLASQPSPAQPVGCCGCNSNSSTSRDSSSIKIDIYDWIELDWIGLGRHAWFVVYVYSAHACLSSSHTLCIAYLPALLILPFYLSSTCLLFLPIAYPYSSYHHTSLPSLPSLPNPKVPTCMV